MSIDGMPPGEFFGDEDEAKPRPKPKPPESQPDARPPMRLVTEIESRPDLLIVPDVHLVTEAMTSALSTDPELYQRGGNLTHIIRASESEPGIASGSPVARATPLSWLIDRVSRFARCGTRRKGPKGSVFAPCPPPAPRVRAVLERGEWPQVRELRGIMEAPFLRPDGTIVQTAGYDAATRYLYEPNAEFLPVDESPSREDCVKAYARLCEPFRDFPYVNGSHLSGVVSALLTMLARAAILGSVPCFLFDASAARSGKSLQVDVLHLIATGRAASRMTYPAQDEELEKVLSGYAIRGSTTVNFDNVERPFGGSALDKVITAVDKVDLRVLGSADLKTFDWRAIVFASGNNVTCRGDMLPRVLAPRIESTHENPENRTDLTHQNLRQYVASVRPELVHAALTLLRGYFVAGCPDMSLPRWGGFEAWQRLIPQALVWVGADDPMGSRRGLEGDEDPDRVASAALVDGWRRLTTDTANGLTVKQALTILYPARSHNDPREPDGHDELREAIECLTRAKPGFAPGSRQLGDALRKLKNRPIAGYKLKSAAAGQGVLRWNVQKV